jgi:ABC-2 type transport system ATP-binding protein
MSLLSLDSVTKRFGEVAAVDGVGFAVDRGEVVGFLGPNGAGKSTTMRMITQYLEPDQGEIRLDGVPLDAAGRQAKKRIGYLAENNPLYTEMLVSEYLDFIVRLREVPVAERRGAIDTAVQETGIETVYYRPIGELSKGFRQRVGLAQAIVHRPDLLVLDEPTEGLDPNQRVEIRRLIGNLGKERTVIVSTHVLPEVRHICSRVVIISRGRIAADGSVDELAARAEGLVSVSVEVEGQGVPAALRALEGVSSITEEKARDGRSAVTLMADAKADVRPAVFRLAQEKGWTLYELHQETASLEDLFARLTREDAQPGAAPAPAGEEGQP